ncbi:MAG: PKD domain-containing protein [Lewinellaceae bacterium]|nr:PKD domain-containing protein [Lewinellaceae bacterium]
MKNSVLTLALLLATVSLFAQWTNETDVNTLVAATEAEDMQSAGTSDGKTYVAYWHNLPGPEYYEMRLQLLDENGYPLFGPEGMLVNNVVPMSSYTVLWSITVDAQDNVYIGFNGSGAGNLAYVHKIAPDGTQLWGATGVNVGAGYDVKVLPLSNGEAIVSWLPGDQGVFQKFDANGNAVWADPVTIQPLVAGHKTSAGEWAEMANGDFVLIFHDRGGFGLSSIPHAQRYDTDGNAVWPSPVALTDGVYTVFNRRYPLRQDGDNLYFGYSGAVGLKFYSYLQRLNSDGTLPWGINGSDFSTQSADYERETEIAFSAGSDYVWAICEYTDPSQGMAGEYVQKFDKETGARKLSDLGKVVFPIDAAYISHRGDLQLIDDQPLFIVSDGTSNGVFPLDLLAVYLDANGDFAWPEETRPVATNDTGVKGRIQLNRPAGGNSVCVWTENRTSVGESRPYAQQVAVACLAPTAGFTASSNELDAAFTSTAVDADSIIWDLGDGNIAIGETITHTYPAPGTYTVCQYVFNACGADTLCQDISVISTGIVDLTRQYAVEIFPNPNHGVFSIGMDLPAATRVSYRIFTVWGKSVGEGTLELTGGEQVIPVQGALPAGSYLLNIQIDGQGIVLPFGVVR